MAFDITGALPQIARMYDIEPFPVHEEFRGWLARPPDSGEGDRLERDVRLTRTDSLQRRLTTTTESCLRYSLMGAALAGRQQIEGYDPKPVVLKTLKEVSSKPLYSLEYWLVYICTPHVWFDLLITDMPAKSAPSGKGLVPPTANSLWNFETH